MFESTSRHEYNYNELSDSWKRIVISYSFNIHDKSLNINGEFIIILVFIVNSLTICCKFSVLPLIFVGMMDKWWEVGGMAVKLCA